MLRSRNTLRNTLRNTFNFFGKVLRDFEHQPFYATLSFFKVLRELALENQRVTRLRNTSHQKPHSKTFQFSKKASFASLSKTKRARREQSPGAFF